VAGAPAKVLCVSDWAEGYRAALRDVKTLAVSRQLSGDIAQLVTDLQGDSDVIDHELFNRRQRAKLRAERELRPARDLFSAVDQ
jgi:hypothetical protein